MNSAFRSPKRIAISAILILMFVFLAALNVINRYYYFTFIAAGIFLATPGRKVRVDLLPILMLLVLGVSWAVFSPMSTISIFGPIKPFAYVLCYIIGYGLLDADRTYGKESRVPLKLFYWTVLVAALGFFVHYLLNWVTNLGTALRNTVDFWSKEEMVATGQASLACVPLAMAVACIFSECARKYKIMAWAVLVVIAIYNLVLAGRTLIVMFAIVAIAAFFFQAFSKRKGRLKMFLVLAIVIAILLMLYSANLFGIRSLVESSALYDRFFGDTSIDLDDDTRLYKKFYYLRNMFSHPFGGLNMRKVVGFSHDLYFDTYDEASIFGFLAISAYMILSLVRLFKCVSNKSLPFMFRQTVFCVYLALNVDFWIEPILQGMPWLFATFCLIDGYVARILKRSQKTHSGKMLVKRRG